MDKTYLHGLCEPFRASVALNEKVLTHRQLRSGLFVSLFRDVYLPVGVPITHRLRCRAASLVVPEWAVLTGHSAAAWHGLELASPTDPIEFIVPEGRQFRSHPGMNVRHVVLRDDEHESMDFLRVATPKRMALDLLLNSRLRKTLGAAVAALDMTLRAGLVDIDTLRRTVTDRHDHGIVRARQAVELADARAESIPESVLRVLLVRAGFAVTPQVDVRHNGVFVGRVDLAVDGTRIAVEYDGEWHADPAQSTADTKRRNLLMKAGWQVIVVRKDDLYQHPERVVEAVRRATYA